MIDLASLPVPHARFLAEALRRLPKDPRIVGVAAGGSLLQGGVDEYSDVDLVVAVEPEAYPEVLASMPEIAARFGPLISAFPGDHVGEPRLLICLYGPDALHVDLKFVSLPDVARRVEDPVILWERDGRLAAALRAGVAAYPQPDAQWVEDRFWTWVHYGAGKIGRGELYEALDLIGYLRKRVLGPMILALHGAQPSGVRRLEVVSPEYADRMRRTLAGHDREECFRALAAVLELYRELRERQAAPGLERRGAAEAAATVYLAAVRRGRA